MQTLSFKCPDKLAEQLTIESTNRAVPRSDLMRRAIIYYLARKSVTSKQANLFMLSQDLCGIPEGPADIVLS